MDYMHINLTILGILKKCNINSFPIDCLSILNNYNIETYPYSSLNDDLREYCMRFSNDALKYRDKICYNDNLPFGRIRFSLMHELGHIILNHSENHTHQMEQEANFFASNILAPRMAIHYANCKNESDVVRLFGLTNEAAQYAFDDYRRWYRWTVYHKMNSFDKELYSHFYNQDANCFVYSIKRCAYCDKLIFNSTDILCKKCKTPSRTYTTTFHHDQDLLIAESQWLYGFE